MHAAGFGAFFLANGRWEVLRMLGSYIVLILLNPLLFRILGDSAFGVVKIWEGLITQLLVITAMGIGTAIMRVHFKFNVQEKRLLFRTALIMSLSLCVLVIFILVGTAVIMGKILGDTNPIPHAIAFSFMLLFMSMQHLGIQWFNVNLRIARAALTSFSMTMLRLFALPAGYISGASGVGFAYGLAAAGSAGMALKEIGSGKGRWFSPPMLQVLAGASFFMVLDTLSASSMRVADRYIIGTQIGSADVAVMFIAMSCASIFIEPVRILSKLLLPYVSARSTLKSFSKHRLRIFFISAGGVVAGVYLAGRLFGPYLMSILYGQEKAVSAEMTFEICLLAFSLNSVYVYMRGFIIRFYKARTQFMMSFAIAVVYVSAAILLVSSNGINGVAQALALTYGIQASVVSVMFFLLIRNLDSTIS